MSSHEHAPSYSNHHAISPIPNIGSTQHTHFSCRFGLRTNILHEMHKIKAEDKHPRRGGPCNSCKRPRRSGPCNSCKSCTPCNSCTTFITWHCTTYHMQDMLSDRQYNVHFTTGAPDITTCTLWCAHKWCALYDGHSVMVTFYGEHCMLIVLNDGRRIWWSLCDEHCIIYSEHSMMISIVWWGLCDGYCVMMGVVWWWTLWVHANTIPMSKECEVQKTEESM